eukprot:1050113-Pleurochrysis_carterae.AAC.1
MTRACMGKKGATRRRSCAAWTRKGDASMTMDGESWPLNLLDVFKKCESMTVFPIPHGMQSRPGAMDDGLAHEAAVQMEEASEKSVVRKLVKLVRPFADSLKSVELRLVQYEVARMFEGDWR